MMLGRDEVPGVCRHTDKAPASATRSATRRGPRVFPWLPLGFIVPSARRPRLGYRHGVPRSRSEERLGPRALLRLSSFFQTLETSCWKSDSRNSDGSTVVELTAKLDGMSVLRQRKSLLYAQGGHDIAGTCDDVASRVPELAFLARPRVANERVRVEVPREYLATRAQPESEAVPLESRRRKDSCRNPPLASDSVSAEGTQGIEILGVPVPGKASPQAQGVRAAGREACGQPLAGRYR